VTLTPADARLLDALASLAESVPERMRAGHLAERARELAERLAMDCTDTQQEVDG
jgi:hypothetical protein